MTTFHYTSRRSKNSPGPSCSSWGARRVGVEEKILLTQNPMKCTVNLSHHCEASKCTGAKFKPGTAVNWQKLYLEDITYMYIQAKNRGINLLGLTVN